MAPELIDIVTVGNVLGEGVLWDDLLGCAWWTDIEQRQLFRFFPDGRRVERFDLPERLGSFGLLPGSRRLVAAFESGFAYLVPETGAIEWIARPAHAAGNIRFNDGRVDRNGRFWAGSMVEGAGEAQGKLYSLGKGKLETHLSGIFISNSLCFSPDGQTMYFTDTPHRTIVQYHCDPSSGALSNRRIFARSAVNAFPDGSAVDSNGYLWNAQWGASSVARYAPDGSLDDVLNLPITTDLCGFRRPTVGSPVRDQRSSGPDV